MTHAAEARRWKLTALASLALLIGYLAGQLAPSATAQPAATTVQLDTSNCRVERIDEASRPSLREPFPAGILTAIGQSTPNTGTTGRTFYFTVCD